MDGHAAGRRGGCRSTRSCSCCPTASSFDAGPDTTTRTLDLNTGQWTTVGTSPIDGQSAVMYRPGQDPEVGHLVRPRVPGPRASTNRAAAIDMTAASPAWREVAPMKYRRSYHTLTVLPDGKVLATGGQTGTDGVDETTGVLAAEIWDPDTDTWTTMASSRRPRLYHSSALLLPDGRVLLAGGGAFGNAEEREERPRSTRRPTCSRARGRRSPTRPSAHQLRPAVHASTRPTRRGSARSSLVRMGSVTHNLDMDQRFMNAGVRRGRGQRDGRRRRRTRTWRRPAATWSS